MMETKSSGNGGVSLQAPERSVGASSEVVPPDPEVAVQARRRQFSAEYKLKVLEEADACQQPGEIAALLRREGLYSSHLTTWRRARRQGSLRALAQERGPKGRRRDPVARENERLRRENARLQQRLAQAETVIAVQKKLSDMLGIPLNPPPNGDDE